MKPLIFSPRASVEVQEAQDWYKSLETNLGERFFQSLECVLSEIHTSPERPRRFYKAFRKVLLSRFPYHVIYEDLSDHIRIIAVVDARRNPATLLRRLNANES